MREREQPPREVFAYSRGLAETLDASSGGRLVGAYLHGSAAMGGWLPSRSDVDLLFVIDDATSAEVLPGLERALVDSAPACPGTGLECSVVSARQASAPGEPWPFLLHVQSSRREPTRIIQGATMDGDPDLLMHYLVCRVAGVPVLGAEPQAVFGTVPRSIVLAHLASELIWGPSTGQRRMRSSTPVARWCTRRRGTSCPRSRAAAWCSTRVVLDQRTLWLGRWTNSEG